MLLVGRVLRLYALDVAVDRLWVRNYRSLLEVAIPLRRCTVVRGENASGKTNVYRSLEMLRHAAVGQLARSILDEGGLPSLLWAGDPPSGQGRKRKPIRVTFGVESDGVSYELNLGRPQADPTSPFALDAEIKEERAWIGPKPTRTMTLLDRSGTTATAINSDGAPMTFALMIDAWEAALSQLGEPAQFRELYALRERMSRWRFYHRFPTDPTAPARSPRPGVRTTVLADDGRDLAAALHTIRELGSGQLSTTQCAPRSTRPSSCSLQTAARSISGSRCPE